jgi:hypothetical protein
LAFEKIYISGSLDGGNPQDQNSIIQTAPDTFTIIPFSEDNDPNYKFRLDVKVINRSSLVEKVDLTIDWQESKWNFLRNYVYFKNEKDPFWTYLPMAVNATQTIGEISFQPGETYLCLHPKYSYEDYLKFILRIPETEFVSKERLGLTPENRELWWVKISNKTVKPNRKIMLVSRIHPYETSGSYCAEGIIDYFLNEYQESSSDILSNAAVYLLPMANPDGVYNGLCKLTAPDGIDLSKQVDTRDPNSALPLKCIDEVRPDVYCEFHNWMFQELDGIYFFNRFQARRFVRNMPSQKYFKKIWKPFFRKKIFSIIHHGFKKHCRDKYGSVCVCLEYPWRYRKISDMKKLGVDTLKALAKS